MAILIVVPPRNVHCKGVSSSAMNLNAMRLSRANLNLMSPRISRALDREMHQAAIHRAVAGRPEMVLSRVLLITIVPLTPCFLQNLLQVMQTSPGYPSAWQSLGFAHVAKRMTG